VSATASKGRPTPEVAAGELFPPMRFGEKTRVFLICCVLLAVAITLGWRLLRPADPQGAVTVVGHPSPWVAVATLVVFAGVGSCAATLAMRGRLSDFGVFAVGVGLAGVGLRGADLTGLLQYEAASAGERGSVFGWLALDVLLWTIVPVVSFVAGAVAEAWADLAGPAGSRRDEPATPDRGGLLIRWLGRAARRSGVEAEWRREIRHGLLTLVIATVVAMVAIRMVAGRPDGPVHPGQVCFAIGAGFWLGTLVASQFCRPALAVWACLAVPVVALAGHLLAAGRPELSGQLGRLSEIGIIAPNALVRGLPVHYLSVGPAAAILGIWTGHRVHRAREEAAEG